MTELIGEVCIPKELVIPQKTSMAVTGAIFLSGGKLWFYTGSAYQLVTSA